MFGLSWLTSGVISSFTKPLVDAYELKLKAQNDHERLEADKLIEQIESARAIAVIEAKDRWSATRVGRLLIVVPYGIWWASIFLVSIVNGLAGTSWTILDIPPKIHEMAAVLIPAIVLGSVIEGFKAVTRRK